MANDFSGDANCLSVYNLEDGALGTDSQGSTTLAVSSVIADTTNYKQGAASGSANAISDIMYVTDASLPSDFPAKSGTTNRTVSIAAWFKPTGVSGYQYITSKYGNITGKRCWALALENNAVGIFIGYNNGNSAEILTHTGLSLTAGQWYHVGATYDGSTKAWRVRVWDDSGSSASESTGTGVQTMNVEDAQFTIFANSDNQGGMVGNIDEVVIFKDVLTADEIDQIRQGIYGAAAGADPTVIMGTVF